ncbi:head-tail connector protein [Mesorhizobium sp.]|uniref:head-tail connector protein n=1 Tax=Mesorhizobium sp. TaxID=1871066 RepID=UPI000FE8F8D3|nr:head-tail connector protein [Mesorhizobium sp.]RWN33434.1 MAG: phage gp6-like head-tail connector protein [Mesorhizobium sp.]
MASVLDFVTIDEVKAALKIDEIGGNSPDDDTTWLSLLITAASRAIRNYLKADSTAFGDSPTTYPEEVKLATIMLIGYMYREPDGDEQKAFSLGNLPFPVTALIYQLRDPTLA